MALDLMILMPVWSPMRDSLFRALAQRPDVRLTVLFERDRLPHRPSWQASKAEGYDWGVIGSYHLPFSGTYRLIPFRLPAVVRSRHPDAIVTVSATQALFALGSFGPRRPPVILWTGESAHILGRRSFPGATLLAKQAVYPFLAGFACYSDATGRFLRTRLGIPRARLFRLPQCTDNAHFETGSPSPPAREKPWHFLVVSRLTPLKGVDRFLSIWNALPQSITENSRLTIAGTGPLLEPLKTRFRRNPEIRFAGFVPFERLPELYHRADIVVLPSLEDTWGFVVNEAMAAARPVLCSVWAHAREMVSQGKTGYLFDPLDLPRAVGTVTAIYGQRHRWAAMGREAQITARRDYTPEQAADALVRGITRILATGKNQRNS